MTHEFEAQPTKAPTPTTHDPLAPQRDRAAPTNHKTDQLAARSLIASLRAGQHALDETPANASGTVVKAQADISLHHMDHAERIQLDETSEIEAAWDQFGAALSAFSDRVDAAEAHPDPTVLKLVTKYNGIRTALGLPERRPPHKRELGSDNSYLRATAPAALELAESLLGSLLVDLEGSTLENRDDKLAAHLAGIAPAVAYARWLVEQMTVEDRKTLVGRANKVANRILDVLAWMQSRTGRSLEDAFQPVIESIDPALAKLGQLAVMKRPPRSVRTVEEGVEGDNETAALQQAMLQFREELGRLHETKRAGIEKFETYVQLEDQPTFLVGVAKAIITASLGHLGGALASALVGRVVGALVGKGARRTVSDSKLGDVATDALQTLIGPALDQGADLASANGERKAQVFFVGTLKHEAANYTYVFMSRLASAVGDRSVSLGMLRVGIEALRALPKHDESYYVEAAKGWALYCARTSVGAAVGPETDQRGTSEMNEYFRNHNFRGKTMGVLDVSFDLHDDSNTDIEPRIKQTKWSINGMNNEIADTVVEDAGGRLDRIYLPKEINVFVHDAAPPPKQPGSTQRTDWGPTAPTWFRMAVDERNQVRDSQWLGTPIYGSRQKFYRDPDALWKRIEKTVLGYYRRMAQAGRKPA